MEKKDKKALRLYIELCEVTVVANSNSIGNFYTHAQRMSVLKMILHI